MTEQQKFQQQIDQYNFPEDLNVTVVSKTIEFKLPVTIPQQVKSDLFNQKFYKEDNNLLVKQKPKANKTYILQGGKFETKVKSLLFILENVHYNEKPIFIAKYIQPQPFPLATNRFCFLGKDIPRDLDLESNGIDKIKSKLILDVSKKCQQPNVDKKSYKLHTTCLTTEKVYLLLTIFNPEQVPYILGLKQDENHDPQIFQLNIPMPVNVLIQYKGRDYYEINFADNNPFKADQIYEQVIEISLPKICETECILATFSSTDPIEPEDFMAELKQNDAIAVFIPDERTLNEDYATTYVEIFIPDLNDDKFNEIDQFLKAYYKKVELAVCKKCNCFFCPSATDEKCYEFFHKGQQIPFESGQMEEIAYDDEEEEPLVIVNYTCCGECPKDEPPENCGKRENGNHEKDENEKEISSLAVKRTLPGNINQLQ